MKFLILFVLLGILLFAGSASAAVDFPADEAGISAYVNAKSSINLNDAKPVFASIERETSDYIIGTVELSLHTEEQYPHVYVSTDGWIVAYYPNDRPSSWILPWADYVGGDISATTLSKAVEITATAVSGTSNGLKYYDFRYPNASKMMMIIESTTTIGTVTNSNYFNVTIPMTFSTYAVDWSHYASTHFGGGGYGWSKTYLDGNLFSNLGCCGTFSANGSLMTQFNKGVEHKIEIDTNRGTGRIGLVIEYAE